MRPGQPRRGDSGIGPRERERMALAEATERDVFMSRVCVAGADGGRGGLKQMAEHRAKRDRSNKKHGASRPARRDGLRQRCVAPRRSRTRTGP